MVPRFRFRPRHRLRRSRDFQRVYRVGGRARGDTLSIVAAPNDLEWTRLGLSVGKSVWRSAVRRNRIRRVFREAFRLSAPELPVGWDLVLIPARRELRPDLAETCAELVHLAALATRRHAERGANA